MALSDLWSELKFKTIAGDAGDKFRSLPLIQRFQYLHTQATPVITLELLPKLKAGREDWLRSAPKTAILAKSTATIVSPTPGQLLFKVRSRLGLVDVISGQPVAAPSSRAILPGSNIDGKRVRVM